MDVNYLFDTDINLIALKRDFRSVVRTTFSFSEGSTARRDVFWTSRVFGQVRLAVVAVTSLTGREAPLLIPSGCGGLTVGVKGGVDHYESWGCFDTFQ